MFSFERLPFCIKTVFDCSQMNGCHSWSMFLSGETQPPLLLCYILLFFLCCCFFFFSPLSYFLLPLHCCAVLINVHTPPHSLFFYNTHSFLLLVLACIPIFFTTFLLNGAFHKRNPLFSSLPTLIFACVCAFSRHTLLHSFCFSSCSRHPLGLPLSLLPPPLLPLVLSQLGCGLDGSGPPLPSPRLQQQHQPQIQVIQQL